MWWLPGWVGVSARALCAAARAVLERGLDAVFGPPRDLPPALEPGPLPGPHSAARAVAAHEAVRELDEQQARRRGEPVPPLPQRSPLHDPAVSAEPVWRPGSPCRADRALVVHTWPDGGQGHTGDLWRDRLTASDMACGDVLELTQVGEAADVYCHKAPRHLVTDADPQCEGLDADGDLRRWKHTAAPAEGECGQDGDPDEGTA